MRIVGTRLIKGDMLLLKMEVGVVVGGADADADSTVNM